MLSIGMEGDLGCCTSKYQVFNEYGYDYDNEYLNNGVCYLIYEKTKTDINECKPYVKIVMI